MSLSPASTLSNLLERVKRLENDTELQRKQICDQQNQIQVLFSYLHKSLDVTSANELSAMMNGSIVLNQNGNTVHPSTTAKSSSSKKISTAINNGKNTSSLVLSKIEPKRAIKFSAKKERALAATKAFVKYLPMFGTKNIAIPSNEQDEILDMIEPHESEGSHVSKKRSRQKMINPLPAADFKKLSTLETTRIHSPVPLLEIPPQEKNGSKTSSETNPKSSVIVTIMKNSAPEPTVMKKQDITTGFELFRFKSLQHLPDRLQALQSLSRHIHSRGPYLVQELLNNGGKELFTFWLRDELEGLLHDILRPTLLIKEITQLLEYATWTAEDVSQSRYDKILKKIYKRCNENAEKDQSLLGLLKKIWPRYRNLYIESNGTEDDTSL